MSDWFTESTAGARVDVPGLLDSKSGELLHEIMGSGALVSVGLTGDGGALSVTVTVDGEWRREYFRSADDLADWLAAGIPVIRERVAAAAARRASSVPRRLRIRP
jgi:hypothetical protein